MIKCLSLGRLEIPFKQGFKHASAERKVTQSILVTAESVNGNRGSGEGCPREYVTGETIDSCIRFFDALGPSLVAIQCLKDLEQWSLCHAQAVQDNPAAWCAVELALLDLLAREADQSVESLLGLSSIEGGFQFTAVIGAESPEMFQRQLEQYRALGLRDFKIKLSGEKKEDHQRLNILKDAGESVQRLRLDANNLWESMDEALAYLVALPAGWFAVEEPLSANRYSDLRILSDHLEVPIILDESFVRREQLECLSELAGQWIINLRISKMGGLLRSLAVASSAAKKGIPLIIGCQVGETSVLTRAALTIAHSFRSSVIAQEGAFGNRLLSEDVVQHPIMFGREGLLQIDRFIEPGAVGFGLDVYKGISRTVRILQNG